ncbi:sulfate permease, SulP family [Ectothiorhodosinus mongolicus]|uniref:Sulfate permease, SulP family n=1 Tax=Ectothiorhodosinus mongolicus TaxID=233100 RepID=A0A1R3VMW4_9GAMM|nr:SulP family inorganic anion transporter [Ectothiorhodosinus mongolicus]ULX56409.1 sodium-independent anion transporter [Ectothiorhodosinus mongolicus]SIT65930.1 sulfate permease, SulP family [Ectothiorhodosinus mongolicus]
MNALLLRLLPFLRWQRPSAEILKADFSAGLAVALVLVPQSMAYAQLAGLPPVYGLYASLLPVIVAALWGSSNQLATGPVAVVSLLTAAALIPLTTPGSAEYIALAILLAFMVGIIQLTMGVLRMGALVSFISHPVIVGFTNAAALIIGLSQLNKLLGIPIDTSGHFMLGLIGMLMDIAQIHWLTLAFGLGAIALMAGLKRYLPKWPGVLVAVVVATLISALIGFENKTEIDISKVEPAPVQEQMLTLADLKREMARLDNQIREAAGRMDDATALLKAELAYRQLLWQDERDTLAAEAGPLLRELRQLRFVLDETVGGFVVDDAGHWRYGGMVEDRVTMNAGGKVIGSIPAGLPELRLPEMSTSKILALMSAAFVIALVGFTEAIAIARAIAGRTGQRLDPNQELIGQGLGNLVGSVTQAYPVSGSFSRSAVNLNAGARTGLSSVFTAVLILLVLLFMTSWFYHLPEAVLAAVIMMAVAGLINFKAIQHAWTASRHDGIAAVVTFVATLAVAPNLDIGILIGVGVAIALFLYRTMRPRVSELARHSDGTLREAQRYGLTTDDEIGLLRFDRSLYFANAPYFEDAVLEQAARHPNAKYLIIVTKGINEIDASGEEVIRSLVARLKARGVTLVFAGLKAQVLEVMERTHLVDVIGRENIYRSTETCIEDVRRRK